MLILSLFVVFCLPTFVFCQKACLEAESCLFEDISYNGTGIIQCYGYRSCEQTVEIISTIGTGVRCWGSYSCYASHSIVLNGSASSNLHCAGLSSCQYCDLIYGSPANLHCSGETSCAHSKLTLIGNGFKFWCNGDRSCESSQLFTQDTLWFYGHASGLNSIIYSNDTGTEINFYGAFSGYNATIICKTGYTCNINCYGNACNNINGFYCSDNNNTSCSINFNDYSLKNMTPINIIGELPSLLNVTMSIYNNTYYPCDTASTNAINAGDYQEYESSSLLQTTDAPICCTGTYGCYNATNNITAIIPINASDDDNNLIGNTGIRCDAIYSCGFAPLIYSVNGNIYVGANQGAWYATIIKTGNKDLYDIFCTGRYSCSYIDVIQNCNNLYCNGNSACGYTKLISNIHNIYSYGTMAAYQVTKIESIDNLYCGGYQSCYETSIINVLDSVYGNNYQVLYNSSIENVGNKIVAAGYQAAYRSTIYNSTSVYCIGEDSCYMTSISGIHDTIYINGYNAISGGKIISETNFDENGTLLIYINGTNDGNTFDIYCNITDICKIACLSSNSCTTLYIHCNDNCFVDCDESNGINCPYGSDYYPWVTNEPSAMPSAMPSSVPTFNPIINIITTSTNDDHDENDDGSSNSSSNSILSIADTVAIVGIITVGLLLCLAMVFVFIHFHKNREYEASMKQMELQKMKMMKSLATDNYDNNNNNNMNKQLSLIDTYDNNSNKIASRSGTPLVTGNENIFDNMMDVHDASLDSVFKDLYDINHNNNNNKNDNNNNNNGSDHDDEDLYEMEGKNELIEAANTTTGHGIGTTTNDGNESDDSNSIDGGSGIDYSNFEQWKQKQVLIWLKKLLLKNKLDKQDILLFLKEFANKNVTGATLVQFLENDKLLDAFFKQFSNENQSLAIWLIVKSGIKDVENNKKMTK